MANINNAISIATEFDKKWEGFENDLGNGYVEAYWDKEGGLWTIGWGSTFYKNGNPINQGDRITYDAANDLYNWELSQKESAIRPYVTNLNKLSDNQYAALISLAYNWGEGRVENSQVLKLINAGASIDQITSQWKSTGVTAQGNYVQGLANRRIDEAMLFAGNYNAVYSYILRNTTFLNSTMLYVLLGAGVAASVILYFVFKKSAKGGAK